jgi:hypothetical protein
MDTSFCRSSPFSAVRFVERESRNTGIFRVLRVRVGGISLQFRLAGGEGGIRTLGTGVSPYNGLAILSTDVTLRNPNDLQSHSLTKPYLM